MVMMDVEKMDGAELLKPEEKRLCSVGESEGVKGSCCIWCRDTICRSRARLSKNAASAEEG